jgi:hypothetical protein
MPPQVTASFKAWLKQGTNMKLSSNSAVTRITYEGITDLDSLLDFDKDSIEALPRACARAIPAVAPDADNDIEAEEAVPAGNISTISVHRLIVAADCVRYYRDVGRTPTIANMHYGNVLAGFKVDYQAYCTLKKQDSPDVPLVYEKDRDKKVIKWIPLFEDAMSRTFGAKGPLRYVIRETADVAAEGDDPLQPNKHYGISGSLMEELINRLPHEGPTYKDDNKTVFMAISKAVAGTTVESTIKTFARTKNGRGAFLALIANHAGDIKYRAIVKARMHLLQNIKWNGRAYALETHVSNHRQAADDLAECSVHINNQVPDEPQRVEYLLDSISCQDSALQAAIGNIRANSNGMRSLFEASAAHMLEVDPYKRAVRAGSKGGNAQVSDVRFTAGRGETGVDLRWHSRKEFTALSAEQRDELTTWQRSSEGKRTMKDQKATNKESSGSKRSSPDGKKKQASWKKKFKKALKTPSGMAHVMSVMSQEDSNVAEYLSTIKSQAPLPPVPPANSPAPVPPATAQPGQVNAVHAQFKNLATSVKLRSILKNKGSHA